MDTEGDGLNDGFEVAHLQDPKTTVRWIRTTAPMAIPTATDTAISMSSGSGAILGTFGHLR